MIHARHFEIAVHMNMALEGKKKAALLALRKSQSPDLVYLAIGLNKLTPREILESEILIDLPRQALGRLYYAAATICFLTNDPIIKQPHITELIKPFVKIPEMLVFLNKSTEDPTMGLTAGQFSMEDMRSIID